MTDPYTPHVQWTPDGLVPVRADQGQRPPPPGDSTPLELPEFYEEDENGAAVAAAFDSGAQLQTGPPPMPKRDDRKELWLNAGVARGLRRSDLEAMTKPDMMAAVRDADQNLKRA